MTQQGRYSGGSMVKASSLSVGDFIRDPRKRNRIMLVVDTGSTVMVRGYETSEADHHRFLKKDELVEKVTNCTTETSKALDVNEGVG